MSTSKITAVIFAKNEENNILPCIASIPEGIPILVVDSLSTDRTRFLAESAGAEVIDFIWNGRYPRKKEWTRQQFLDDEWLLLLDADLRCNTDLYQECLAVIANGEFAAGQIKIDYWFMGKKMKFGSKASYFGLINVGKCKYPDVEIENYGYGDIEFHYQPECRGEIAKLKSKIEHNDPDPLVTWIERHLKYANYQAQLKTNPVINAKMMKYKTLRGRILYSLPLRATFQFLYSYFIKFGFLDGLVGFRFAYLHAHHYYLARILFLDHKQKKCEM